MVKQPIETEHEINGVSGKLFRAPMIEVKDSLVYQRQNWVSQPRSVSGEENRKMYVMIRFDDSNKNGHQTFSITGAITRSSGLFDQVGAMTEEIKKNFPELAPLLRWHLVSTDGPLHYLANTIYHAGDRDYRGKRAGQPTRYEDVIYLGDGPVAHKVSRKLSEFIKSRMLEGEDGSLSLDPASKPFKVVTIAHDNRDARYATQFDDRYTFEGFGDRWHECPFKDEATAQEWAEALNTHTCKIKSVPVEYSKGKARDLDAARATACWPEATDEQLMVEPEELREALEKRLPALMEEFRSDMERIGMGWEMKAERTPSPKF